MNLDWKDALDALRASGTIPEDNSPEPEAPENPAESIQKEPLHVVTDRKGRKGKTATIVEGFLGSDSALDELAKTLKQKLGTGGSARAGEILIQGDRKKDVADILRSLGYKVKG